VIAEYERLEAEFTAHRKTHRALIDLPSVTRDGVSITLEANIGKGVDVESALLYQAQGIGLYRTEFHFMIRPQFPDEEEQYTIYQRVVERMAPHPVTIRTLDLGGDKYLSYLPRLPEVNPYLGWRAIRVSLEHPAVLRTQLRAILRASMHGRSRILFPMIATMEDLRRAKEVLREAEKELCAEGIPYDKKVSVGAMIEVPSAAILARLLICEVDFVSIGTNDLTQFTLAVDRSNEKVSRYYEPLSPAILWLLRYIIQAVRGVDKEVAICGEMAGEPAYVQLLLGLGLRHFSMSPVLIPDVKEVIRSSTIPQAEAIAERALAASTAEEVKEILDTEQASI
jgi:phosphotransferase system enzyme I (PtsI)